MIPPGNADVPVGFSGLQRAGEDASVPSGPPCQFPIDLTPVIEVRCVRVIENDFQGYWMGLTLVSACFLGAYDLFKKHAVHGNATIPTLFFSVLAGAVIWGPLAVWQHGFPNSFSIEFLQIQSLSWREHGLVLMKSILVSGSWLFGYVAVKHLPLTITGPVRSTSPLWTILIALTLMGERPSLIQWTGAAIILGSFYAFSLVGKLEGIRFHKDRWIAYLIAATILGACSGVYDKYLFQNAKLDPSTVQCWFSIDLPLVILPFFLHWLFAQRNEKPFEWRWSIPMIGWMLLISDWVYFTAVSQPDALISIISPMRRTSMLIVFLGGHWMYKESNIRRKAFCMVGMLIGVWVLKMES